MYHPKLDDIGGRVRRADLSAVLSDRGQMTRLFQNLIGDAIKFRCDQPLSVTIAAGMKGDYWELVVEDNGIGIESSSVESVCNMFDRLHSRHEYPGNGLGPALCRRIVNMRGGRIWAKPRTKQGKVVAFRFTLAKEGPIVSRTLSQSRIKEIGPS